MLLPVPVLAGKTHDDDGPQVKASCHQLLACLQHLGGGNTFVDGLEHRVAAALHPQVSPVEARIPDGLQLLGRFGQGAPGTGVGGHLLQGRESIVELAQHPDEIIGLHDDRVAIHEKHSLEARTVVIPGHIDVLQNLLHRTDAEFLLLIHGTEGALIIGAADGTLEQVALPLPWGPVQNVTVVSHKSFPFFSQNKWFRSH